jgi:hypothetical protein
LPGTGDILIVNNTLFGNQHQLQISDDHEKGKAFLECKNIRFQNNLVLAPGDPGEMRLFDHQRGIWDFRFVKPGDLKSLLASPDWQLSFNWHESCPPGPGYFTKGTVIPPGVEDRQQVPIEVLSRRPSDPNFLRPAKDSPLAFSGAGGQKAAASDLALPAYVGAVPPEGVEPWDWDQTWSALAH